MDYLKTDFLKLRALEPEDIDFLFSVENDENLWEVSGTLTPFSKDILKQYLNNAHLDIYEAKQLRLVIVDAHDNNIGLVDLFDYQPQHQRAGIGILILKKHQNMGYASKALKLFIHYAFTHIHLHQIYANIPIDNTNSIQLFEKMNFNLIGTQKEWIQTNGNYKDVLLYQLIKE